MMEKIKQFFLNSYRYIMAHGFTSLLVVIIIGVGQIALDYGSFKVYALVFLLGLLYTKVVSFILKRI